VFAVALMRASLSRQQWMGINLLTAGLLLHGMENFSAGGGASSKVCAVLPTIQKGAAVYRLCGQHPNKGSTHLSD
jgi:hypothetical protein